MKLEEICKSCKTDYQTMIKNRENRIREITAEVERLRGAMAESGVGEELEEGQE